jgi:hypothetical protein
VKPSCPDIFRLFVDLAGDTRYFVDSLVVEGYFYALAGKQGRVLQNKGIFRLQQYAFEILLSQGV